MVNWLRGRRGDNDCENGVSNTLNDWTVMPFMLIAALFVGAGVAFAQTRGGAVTIRYTTASPFIALLAGILILVRPRLLNYVVAIYLIVVGLVGLNGIYHIIR